MDERLTVKVGQEVRTADGYVGYVRSITDGGMSVYVFSAPDSDRLIGRYHPTKVWPA